MKIVEEAVSQNTVKSECTGSDDLLARFGLNRVYALATTAPPVNPYTKLKLSIDRRLFKSERWSLAAVAEWPEHHFKFREFSSDEIRRALPLLPGGFDLKEEERGVLVSDPMPTTSEGGGTSEATAGSRPKIKTKIKLKTGGIKRPRQPSQEPAH
ncbi:hypothetical protein CEUSTIGMA_g10340.t1 [Chlamydomonas eustigma]|uniref:Uncharacterized protein n=1 Tax=Chlamydomonas eustigma TaxID=1157962 RepID=A0A250XIL4_9CHLO|nr:hypothetical protein CEUSTIGMA_g10340.t1 [Chlamydomonas eustigma]|eukprot:GAX82914.1 hypothetical protein CEUSTIGMA_g10340.t1 [Chlamydomonas eustigma]